ncbi:MAG: hypothetical protein JWN72_1025 [Thermoleophilia bacterium]|nr:hypothetical protein [Thermoleophilia bacterium]
MATFVTLQLNATDVAGDWAIRSAGTSRTATGEMGARTRRVNARRSDHVAVYLSELRGAVEAIKAGAHSPNIAESRTEGGVVGFGAPAMYHGMRFSIGVA